MNESSFSKGASPTEARNWFAKSNIKSELRGVSFWRDSGAKGCIVGKTMGSIAEDA